MNAMWALGQYGIYQSILAEIQPERELYLAVPLRTYSSSRSTAKGVWIPAFAGMTETDRVPHQNEKGYMKRF